MYNGIIPVSKTGDAGSNPARLASFIGYDMRTKTIAKKLFELFIVSETRADFKEAIMFSKDNDLLAYINYSNTIYEIFKLKS